MGIALCSSTPVTVRAEEPQNHRHTTNAKGTSCVTTGGGTSKANNDGRQGSKNRVRLPDYKSYVM